MKKLIVLISAFLLTFLVSSLNAQIKNIKLGLQGGSNFATNGMDPTPTGQDVGIRTGLLFGGIFNYSFSPMFSLQIEPAYIQRGSSLDVTTMINGMTQKSEGSRSVNYLDIPVLVKASFGAGKVKPFAVAGVSAAFLLGDAKYTIDKVTQNGQDITNQLSSDQKENTLKTKSTDFLLNVGGGVTIPVGKADIFIEGQYNLGIIDLNDNPEINTVIVNGGLQLKVGALFSL